MASRSFAPDPLARRGIPITDIDAAVCARLGSTRVLGNSQPACFNRQVAMYLAKHVGGWATKIISRFYHGRDHSTVTYSIQRIEALRDTDADVDTLISELWQQLVTDRNEPVADDVPNDHSTVRAGTQLNAEQLADLVAERVCAYWRSEAADSRVAAFWYRVIEKDGRYPQICK